MNSTFFKKLLTCTENRFIGCAILAVHKNVSIGPENIFYDLVFRKKNINTLLRYSKIMQNYT